MPGGPRCGWFIVFSGILDVLDGRVARLSNTGTKFGAELDSLVDVISFGVAPALLIYFLDFASAGRFAWVLSYIYVTGVALRLARFNVLSAGKPSTGWFTGLPSPSLAPDCIRGRHKARRRGVEGIQLCFRRFRGQLPGRSRCPRHGDV